ncbi:MAG: dihydrodipicolinate synthase family protein [Christensenellales bacterium]
MKQIDYKGIYPAFCACYDDVGNISPARAQALARHLQAAGVQGLYVNGSTGECVYLSVEERMQMLEAVMDAVGGTLPIIAHVACNNTRDSVRLAAHAGKLGVSAIAAIPPIYFKLPEYAIADYWNAMSDAAPETDFMIYNIPQNAGVALTLPLLETMLKNPRVKALKNSSPSVQDIRAFKDAGGGKLAVLNGPDEQYLAGRLMGADGGIGSTYNAMPALFLAIDRFLAAGQADKAQQVQQDIFHIIMMMLGGHGNLMAVIKELLRRKGVNTGLVRAPLPNLIASDRERVDKCEEMIAAAEQKVHSL